MSFDVSVFSRFRDVERIRFRGVDTFGTWKVPEVFNNLTEDDVIKYVVPAGEGGRPDIIAFNQYGNSHLMWILITYNNATDLDWPRAHEVIDIPARRAIGELL
jgi:hypothetical protein